MNFVGGDGMEALFVKADEKARACVSKEVVKKYGDKFMAVRALGRSSFCQSRLIPSSTSANWVGRPGSAKCRLRK